MIPLFQLYNIFGSSSSLTYGPQLQDYVQESIYSMYSADEVSGHKVCCERTTQAYSHVRGRYDLSRVKTSKLLHVVGDSNWVITRSRDAD